MCWDSVIHELDHRACGGRTRLHGRFVPFIVLFCLERIGILEFWIQFAIFEPSYIHLTSLE